jgi:hypothetical protein
MTSVPTPTFQPTWLIKNDHQSTFNTAEKAAAKLATAAAALTFQVTSTAGLPMSTPELPPHDPHTPLTSLLKASFITLPSFPHINLSSFTHLHYPIFVPKFAVVTSTSHTPHSATSHTPTASSMNIFAETLAALLTHRTKCPACPRLN